jgi:hypothetical protein
MYVKSYIVMPWKAFPAWSNVILGKAGAYPREDHLNIALLR